MQKVKRNVAWLTPILLASSLAIGCRQTADLSDSGPGPDAPVLSDIDAGALYTQITINVNTLDFAIVGDTRPSLEDRDDLYPTAVINQIWTSVQNETPRPDFAVSTGDYMFARTSNMNQLPQVNLYLAARAKFSGQVFPA